VSNTVARLQPAVAVRLLTAALDRMRTKPARGEQLARWMRTVMLHHAVGGCTAVDSPYPSAKGAWFQPLSLSGFQSFAFNFNLYRYTPGFITSSGKAQSAVMELQQTVEAHVAMQRPLLGLLGRLDLLLHKQQQQQQPQGGDGAGGDGGEGPLSTYTEGEDDVDVLDDEMDGGDSEEDWETDDDDDDVDEDDDDDDDDDDDSDDDME
jgi:U3 small nucleolar RNA-associated protein 5